MFSRLQRAQLTAIAAQAAALLEADDEERAAVPERAPVASADPSVCEHPESELVAANAMGHPNARVCKACGTTVEV